MPTKSNKNKIAFIREKDDFCSVELEAGLIKLGYEVKRFNKPEEMLKMGLSVNTPVCGSIYGVRKALWLLKKKQPENIDIPESLQRFAKRKVWKTTLGEIRKITKKSYSEKTAHPFEIFIKPLYEQKRFSGHIYSISRGWTPVSSRNNSLVCKFYENSNSTRYLPNSYPILAQERVYFKEEHRSFIFRGKIVGGDFFDNDYTWLTKKQRIAGIRFVETLVESFQDAPVAYVLDVGLMAKRAYSSKKSWALVEFNDGFSFGLSNLESKLLAQMMVARWKELVKD